jgi:hypothetical protein
VDDCEQVENEKMIKAATVVARRRIATNATSANDTNNITTTNAPVIDTSLPLEDISSSLHDACSTMGFFTIINHNVLKQLQSEILNETRRMFYELSGREKDGIK